MTATAILTAFIGLPTMLLTNDPRRLRKAWTPQRITKARYKEAARLTHNETYNLGFFN